MNINEPIKLVVTPKENSEIKFINYKFVISEDNLFVLYQL